MSTDVERSFGAKLLWAFTRYAYIYPFVQLLVFLPVQWSRTDPDRDVVAYYLVAQKIEAGTSVYEPRPLPGPHQLSYPFYLYPPFLAGAVGLLPAMTLVSFARFWLVLMLVAFWCYAACLGRLATGRWRWKPTLVAGALLSFFPGTLRALSLGQVDPALWALFGAALAVPALRGAGFAASAMVKIYAGWPLLFAWYREGQRVFWSAVAIGALSIAVGAATMGPTRFVEEFETWFRYILPGLGQGQFSADNVSLSMLGLRIARLLGWEYTSGIMPGWARSYLLVVGLGAPLIAGALTRRRSPVTQYAVVGCAAAWFGPIFWTSYLPLLLAPLAIWFRNRNAERSLPSNRLTAVS